MITKILIALVVAFVLFELVEHVVIPLIWFILGKKRRSISAAEGMLGEVAEIKKWNKTAGQVFVNGSLWRAVSDVPLLKGDKVVIRNVEGLTLRVEPFKN